MTRRLPPGPRGLPFLGSLLEFRKDPLGFSLRMARDYGDIAHFRLGSQHFYQLNHPDIIQGVLVNNHRNFVKTRGVVRARALLGNGLITSEGAFHLKQRRMMQPAFSRQQLETYGGMMPRAAESLGRRWSDGATVDMLAEMTRLTLSVIGQTLFGMDTTSHARDVVEAMDMVCERLYETMRLPFFRLVERLPLPTNVRFAKAKAALDAVVYDIIRSRRASDRDEGDLLSTLLAAVDTEGDGTGMTDRQVRDEIMTMFLAGHETNATLMCWTLYALSTHHDVEQRLHAEIDEVLGSRLPNVADVPKLPYVRMVISESMRLYPPVWAIPRKAVEDYPVGAYMIPGGSIVGMSQFVVHRDSRYYPEPEKFDPMRWTPEEIDKRPRYSYFPFGGGARQCIGEGMAWMEATLLLATLCQRWQFKAAPGYTPQFLPGITLRPKGALPMIITKRKGDNRIQE